MAGSLSKQAYQEIRSRILTLDLAPGAVLYESDLVQQLGIGRTPVREALQRLAAQHFVVVRPRKGMFVTDIDTEELPLLFETRSVLEPYAARLAADRGTADDWEEMARVLETVAGGSPSSATLLDADRRCHEIIWTAARNPFLTDNLDSLYAQSERTWHRYLSDVADMSTAIDEHRELLEVLQSGDGDRAEAIMTGHVTQFMDEIQSALSHDGSASSPTAP